MIDKTQRLYESLDSFLTEYKEKNEGNKYRPVAVGRYGIRTRESIYSKELAKDYSKNKLIFKNTLTVGMGSTQIDIGVLSDDATYAVSPAYHTYRINGINSDYLRYCLECRNQDMFVRYVKRGSRQGKSIDLKRWITYKIPVYPESVQAEIVKRLDSVKAILSFREQELNALDELIRARFVEMFGDCKELITLKDLCSIITDGTHQPPQFQDSGIPFILVSNLSQNTVTYDTKKYISEETYNELIKRTPIEVGDVLLSTVGSYGHPAVVTNDKKFLFQRHIAYLKPKRDIVNSFYLHGALLAPDAQRQIEEKVKGIAQKTLNLSEIKKIVIPLPSIECQNAFEQFVSQIDKSKATVQKALDETQLLFDSLMQQYFG